MWDINFTSALALFTVLLTPIFLLLLVLSEKTRSTHEERACSTRPKTAIVGIFSLEVLAIFLLNLPVFKGSLMYPILLVLITSLLMYTLRSSSSSKRTQMLVLASAILCHLAFIYLPPSGLRIHERTAAIEKLALDGYWDPSVFSAYSVYSPIAMDAGFFSVLSIVTSVSSIDPIKDMIIFLVSTITYDVLLYSLCKRVTHSWVAGILAVIMLASTPPANFVFHGSKWFASLLVLASVIALIKAFDGVSSISNIAVANITYVAAIFFHPSAAIGGFLPLGVVVAGYFARKTLKGRDWKKLSESGLFRATAALLVTATFARAVYTVGYLEAMLPSLRFFLEVAFGYSPGQELSAPVYEQSVDPINALPWTTPVAMTLALILYGLLRRKALGGKFTLIMSYVGMTFLFVGYLSAAARAGGFQGAMYPGFIFLIPSAAALGERVLGSSKILSAILIVVLGVSVGIASTDPRFYIERYRTTGAGDVDTKLEDYTTSLFLVDRIPSSKALFMPYEIVCSFYYLEVAADAPSHRAYTTSADLQRMEIDRVVTGKELLPGVMYIWPERWLSNINSHVANMSVNIYCDSVRHVVFEK